MTEKVAQRFDRSAVALARRLGVPVLRIALGVVFIWFGALKVAGASPVAGLVAETVPLLGDRAAVVAVGVVEILVGIGLITGWLIRLTLAVFFAQMLGTFLVLITQPRLSFQGGNPLRLTVLGEFVLKNIVLLAAGVVVAAASIPPPRRDEGLGEMLTKNAEPAAPVPTQR